MQLSAGTNIMIRIEVQSGLGRVVDGINTRWARGSVRLGVGQLEDSTRASLLIV